MTYNCADKGNSNKNLEFCVTRFEDFQQKATAYFTDRQIDTNGKNRFLQFPFLVGGSRKKAMEIYLVIR